jgi:hypothetical protein
MVFANFEPRELLTWPHFITQIFINFCFIKDHSNSPPHFDQKFEQLQQKFQMQNQEDLNKIFNNNLLEMNKNSMQSPFNYLKKETAINENNQSLTDSTESFTDNQYGNTCDEQKKASYYDHDISDLELGYTKKQSSEYYDDVKRNLKFDDDDEDESQSDTEFSDNKEKNVSKIANQISSNQSITKALAKNFQKNFNGAKSLNSSISNSTSLNSIVNASSSKITIPQKPSKRANHLQQEVSNNSSQNRSMISLQMSPNQRIQQQGSSKNVCNIKDVNVINSGNNKSTTAKPNIGNLNSSNKRVWK